VAAAWHGSCCELRSKMQPQIPKRTVSHTFLPATLVFLMSLLLLVSGGILPAQARRGGPAVNGCGCFEESPGVCKCLRKSKCGCPGECEPLGCEEKRQKDLSRRMEKELKKLREDDGDADRRKPARDGSEDENKESDGNGDGVRGNKEA
jgi:hypothetical protein